jgi:hypothetical protein
MNRALRMASIAVAGAQTMLAGIKKNPEAVAETIANNMSSSHISGRG